MNGKFGMAQLAFVMAILIIVSAIGYMGFSWLESRMGWQMSFAMFMVVFVVVILFVQQYLSMASLRGVLENIVNYNSANAKVDAFKQQTVLEGMKVTRQVLASDAKASLNDVRILEQRANQIGELLGNAKGEQIKAKLMAGDSQTIDSQDYTLD